jgi:hypothetical protein
MKVKALATFMSGALTCGVATAALLGASSAAQGAGVRYHVVTKTFVAQPYTPRTFTVKCPSGMVALGGGGHYGTGAEFGGEAANGVFGSDISSNHRGWTLSVDVADGSGPSSYSADVVCAAP